VVVAAVANIDTSPAARAVETAESVAAGCGVREPIRFDPRLREADFGRVDGRTFDELAASEPALAAAILDGRTDVDWPDGERATDLVARVHAAWLAIERLAAHRDVVVVTHGGVARVMVALATEPPGLERAARDAPGVDAHEPPALLSAASWVTLVRAGGGWAPCAERGAEPAAAAL